MTISFMPARLGLFQALNKGAQIDPDDETNGCTDQHRHIGGCDRVGTGQPHAEPAVATIFADWSIVTRREQLVRPHGREPVLQQACTASREERSAAAIAGDRLRPSSSRMVRIFRRDLVQRLFPAVSA